MKLLHTLLAVCSVALPIAVLAQGADRSRLAAFPDAWPTHYGDYSGRRYSPLAQITVSNVKTLSLAWIHRAIGQETENVGGEYRAGDPYYWGRPQPNVTIKSTPLMTNGVLYFAAPDHAYAIDARTGRPIWHYFWRTRGGIHIGNRGVGLYGNMLFFETPDCYLVSLDASTGKERWHKEIADVRQEYFCTPAPIIIGRHVIVGIGGDSLDVQGYLESYEPETGERQWRWYTTPQKMGEPGSETWPDEYAMTHGGGMTWLPPTYDPELNLLYIPTGNPNPVFAPQSRKGDNLYTCALVALNPDTGTMAWYFQTSPHDTHDWDSAQVPVLIDGQVDGRPRKLVAQAARNGYYFLIDRTNGKSVLTRPYVDFMNWSLGVNANGQPINNPAKDATVDGVLVSPGSATNWPPPSFSPRTGLLYVGTSQSYNLQYLTDTDERPEGYGGGAVGPGGGGGRESYIKAIDYRTGNVRWRHALFEGGAMGLLTTGGDLLFGGDGSGNFVAYDASTGDPVWHAGLAANPSNAPITFMLDDQQFLVVGAGDSLYAFTLAR
ncbi:MAG TPA: acido-empty-quinoprotein group A [Vicinamibacterales bacterium]|nr:acido-empty-quinoprotein group A [Vicinamibacterales bacterium]